MRLATTRNVHFKIGFIPLEILKTISDENEVFRIYYSKMLESKNYQMVAYSDLSLTG